MYLVWPLLGPLSTEAGSQIPPTHPEANCVEQSKDLADEKADLGAGWNGVKKASSRELTLLDGQKGLGNWRGPGFSLPGLSQLVATYSPLWIPSA